MFGDMEDVIVVPDSKQERAAGGFQNTLLHGLAVERKSESPKEAEPKVEVVAIEEPKKGARERLARACRHVANTRLDLNQLATPAPT